MFLSSCDLQNDYSVSVVHIDTVETKTEDDSNDITEPEYPHYYKPSTGMCLGFFMMLSSQHFCPYMTCL